MIRIFRWEIYSIMVKFFIINLFYNKKLIILMLNVSLSKANKYIPKNGS